MNKKLKYLLGLLVGIGIGLSSWAQVTSVEDKKKVADENIMLDYVFRDSLDREVRLRDFAGKYLFIDIWYSGCGGCITANEGLSLVHEKLRDTNIVFFSVSVDKEKIKWMASVTPNAKPSKMNPWASKYVPHKGTVVLYTGGTGYSNTFIEEMVPSNVYPKLLMIDKSGKLISDRPPRPDDDPEQLVDFIKSNMKK